MTDPFLPTTPQACAARGWTELDVIVVSGDAYVDHPAFPAALIGRVLEAEGLRVAVLARPNPDSDDLARLGEPRLFFAIAPGAVDSMVANYTAQKRPRSDDAYAPGGQAGGRPDRALIAYAGAIRRLFGRFVPILAGGVEASTRRFAHYDYWDNRVRRPILLDAPADALIYGMGEAPLLEIVRRLRGQPPAHGPARVAAFAQAVRDVAGVVWRSPASQPPPAGYTALPAFEEVRDNPQAQVQAFLDEMRNRAGGVYQESAGKRVIANPPPPPLATAELDRVYDLPFQRASHPQYAQPVPALAQVQFSITSHRGCCGGCSFCAISLLQGKTIQSRSAESILREVRLLAAHPDFAGTIRDIGGATANLWGARCGRDQPCDRPSCLAPKRCPHFVHAQEDYVRLLREASRVPGVKHLFVSSGVRMDLALECPAFIQALAGRHTSGQLKVAPEHVTPAVLKLMNKPAGQDFPRFLDAFRRASAQAGKEQYVLPYFIAAHPGSRMEDMIDVALFLRRNNIAVEQCQIFTPTPGTASTVMYATGLDPFSGQAVFVERNMRRREMQKALILFRQPQSRPLVLEALRLAGRPGLARELLSPPARRR
ncbi:MAG TPA: YgiQ family radical SAM protein [Candidatus Brocadiia bacterium]|nr:YgiQ family radical SAM protein [Candidatus Brocadiia bacterium]